MPFDFRTRANELADKKAKQQRDEVQKRDRDNEIAREIVQGLLAGYAGRLGNQFAAVQGNVATVAKQNGVSLKITVLSENKFNVEEKGATGGFREPTLHEHLQKKELNKTDMMDTIIEWLAEN